MDHRSYYEADAPERPEPLKESPAPKRKKGESDEDFEKRLDITDQKYHAKLTAQEKAHDAHLDAWHKSHREWFSDPTKKVGAFPAKDGSKKDRRFHLGFIAQEMNEVVKDLGHDYAILNHQAHPTNPDGEDGLDIWPIAYDELIAPAIKAIQELSAGRSPQAEPKSEPSAPNRPSNTSRIAMNGIAKVGICLVMLFLSACAGGDKYAIEPCALFTPITASKNDTTGTLRQVLVHNDTWETLCKP